MANTPKPASDPHRADSASPPPATPRRDRRRPWATLAILAGLAVNLALCVRRVGGEDRGALAFVGFSYLNLLLLFGAIRRFEASPADGSSSGPAAGSSARRRARLVLWALSATFMAAFTWRMTALLPLSFTIVAAAIAAAAIGFVVYVL
ncbi:hypothetical protein PVAP13_4NG052900 [Panicum virgatum]|uniref:Uncharacterized protein n=1 Tax=Panicum virgatum TaxID=38727 RepID=A0A8T0T1K4_PANVG|nr:hypothetical protein PVAP13_4NG052900 [Panicum virgatum]